MRLYKMSYRYQLLLSSVTPTATYQSKILGLTDSFCQQSNEELTMINHYNEIQTYKMHSVLLGMWQKNPSIISIQDKFMQNKWKFP